MRTLKIERRYKDSTTNLILDTLRQEKQALVFVGAKRSAEKVASDAAKKIKDIDQQGLADQILSAVSSPTEQCRRLADCVRRGIAFHHSGLAPKQRTIVEDAFREGYVRIIGCTPTLAAGLDMPAFRTIIRDLKRYQGRWGMQYIPVLEYEQMAGRAGRPGQETFGEAIIVASNERQQDELLHLFVKGDVEEITSKLAVEPVLRTYILALVASGFVTSTQEAESFFSETFWAHHYGDMHKLRAIIDRVVLLLRSYGFIEGDSADGFTTARNLMEGTQLRATPLGARIAELYLDPYTGDRITKGLQERPTDDFGILHLLCTTLEIRPLPPARAADMVPLEEQLRTNAESFMQDVPSIYDPEYEEFLQALKMALCLRDWMDEAGEDLLLARYGIRPGELRAKLDIMNWLIFCSTEIAKMINQKRHVAGLTRLRTRLMHGIREELLPLVRFKNVGRVRARKLHAAGIRTAGDIKKTTIERLSSIIGPKMAKSVKEEVGGPVVDFSSLSEDDEII